MNLYTYFEIEHTSNLDLPNAEAIEKVLNAIVTPKLNSFGLSNEKKKYVWQGEYNANGIKPIVRFKYRALDAAFLVGVNFKFVPSLTEHKQKAYYNHTLQIYENSGFFEKRYSIRLWNESFFRKSLQKYADKNFRKIIKFLNQLDSIEANIALAEKQLVNKRYDYRIYNPELKFVLAYLYKELGNLSEAQKYKASFLNDHSDYKDSIFSGFN